jgi:hypothetical protein
VAPQVEAGDSEPAGKGVDEGLRRLRVGAETVEQHHGLAARHAVELVRETDAVGRLQIRHGPKHRGHA